MCKSRRSQGIDPLTKLWTEDTAKRLIENYQSDGNKYEGDALYLICLDGWRELRQTGGVEEGNSALRQIAFLLGQQFKKPDVTARIGDNAFLVYDLGCQSAEEARLCAEELKDRLSNLCFFKKCPNRIKPVIGAVWCRGNIREYSRLLRLARYAAAKAGERGQEVEVVTECDFPEELGLKTEKVENITPYHAAQGQTDIEFITELTDLLFLCEDAEKGIRMSLERLCRYFDAERAFVMELSSDQKYFETTYEYCTDSYQVVNDNLKYISSFFIRSYKKGFDENGICICNSLSDLEKISHIIAEREKIYGTKALMQCAVLENGSSTGYISISDTKHARLWSRKEMITYLMAGKIITASILRVRSLRYSLRVAYRDLLTESWNKNKFLMEAGKSPVKDGKKKAVVTVDLKNFKIVNQEFGYEIGNEVLIEISNLLRLFIETDECYARIEADTFVVLLYYRDRQELEERIRQFLGHVEHLSARMELMFSFVCMAGICTEEDICPDIQEMMECADIARKSIKEYHKSGYAFCSRETQMHRDKEKYMASRMKTALKDGEFLVYYQPRVDIRSREYISMEALSRWQPPDEEMIMPGDFIPLFEQNGFISELDLFVFEQVCREIRDWMEDGRKIYPVAVNISRVHIKEKHFLENLEKICRKYGVPVNGIELELTESAFLNNPDIIMDAAVKIKEKGFQLSMDDFGTGFSSLSLLKDIPVDIIKLDKTFFQNRMTEKEKIIISHVIQMTRELQIEVVSEGIETKEHERFLKEIGCDVAQGFLYARPEPLEVHEAKLWKDLKHRKQRQVEK